MQIVIRGFVRAVVVKIARFFGIHKLRRSYGVYLDDADRIFKELEQQHVSYVVLRWFDDLPTMDPQEDIDMLVADSDFSRIKKILQKGRGGSRGFVQFDIYPESNLTGDIAYYPPHLASQILQNKRQLKCGIWVPSTRYHFLSLTYHALFHKGFASGLSSDLREDSALPYKQDFRSYLMSLADRTGIEVNHASMEELESILEQHSWLPPLDVYFRRSKKNNWARLRANQIVDPAWRLNHGLVIFFLRELIAGTHIEEHLKKMIVENGASIVDEIHLNKIESLQVVQRTRGGDWGRPRLGKSYAGLPTKIIVARRVNDITAPDNLPMGVVECPWLMEIKKNIRAEANRGIPYRRQCHVLHTSDNGVEASYYLDLILQVKASDSKPQP